MSSSYTYRKRIRHHHHKKLRNRAVLAAVVVMAIIGGVAIVAIDLLKTEDAATPVSKAEQIEISEKINTFQSDFFKFSDSGNWVHEKELSQGNKIIYHKYRGKAIEHILSIYVNQTPEPLYLATSRALPVRMVNHNRLDVTNVTKHCVTEYGKSTPHKVKTVTIENSEILCDPDTNFYTVTLAEIGGNYELKMRHSSGKPVQFVIQYRDMTGNNVPDTIRQIAATFEAL